MNLVILVVDDMRENAESVARILRHHGHSVDVETSSIAAMAILKSEAEIDLTILDVVMPDLNGAEIYERCEREAPARCERIMFVTGFGEFAPSWFKRTGRFVLEKPIDASALMRAVDAFKELQSPRGPRYPDGRRRIHSVPRLPQIIDEDDDEEITGITRAVRTGDPFARRLQEMFEAYDQRMKKIETHFENNPSEHKFGMVTVMYNDMDFIKRSINFWPKIAGAVVAMFTVLGAVATWWLSAHQPPPVDYNRMRIEMQKIQQQEIKKQ